MDVLSICVPGLQAAASALKLLSTSRASVLCKGGERAVSFSDPNSRQLIHSSSTTPSKERQESNHEDNLVASPHMHSARWRSSRSIPVTAIVLARPPTPPLQPLQRRRFTASLHSPPDFLPVHRTCYAVAASESYQMYDSAAKWDIAVSDLPGPGAIIIHLIFTLSLHAELMGLFACLPGM